jgi:hypothetical protein
MGMKSTELKRVICFTTTSDFKKGIDLIREGIHWEYSGFLHAINFYTLCEFDLAHRRLVNAGMVRNQNFVVHS